jgi:hypothetical protein
MPRAAAAVAASQGGLLLQAQGLQSVVTDEQYQQLATAEVVQQAYGLQKVQTSSCTTLSLTCCIDAPMPVLSYTLSLVARTSPNNLHAWYTATSYPCSAAICYTEQTTQTCFCSACR